METGSFSVASLPGGFDLQATVESGQTYVWSREDDRMFEASPPHGGSAWYVTVLPATVAGGTPAVVRVRQRDGVVEWESSIDAHDHLVRLLRLDDDLDAIMAAMPITPTIDMTKKAGPSAGSAKL